MVLISAYRTLPVLAVIQEVSGVPELTPVTNTEMNWLLCFLESLSVLFLAPAIALQPPGTVDRGFDTEREHAYHW